MRFFFRSRQFKIIAAVAVILIIISAVTAFAGSRMSPQADIAGTITAPFRSVAAKISNGISDFVGVYTEGEKLSIENAELETEISELRKKLADYEKATKENEFYKLVDKNNFKLNKDIIKILEELKIKNKIVVKKSKK